MADILEHLTRTLVGWRILYGEDDVVVVEAALVEQEDMRAAWIDAVKEMKQEREAMRGEWQAARESIEEGLSKLMKNGEAGNAEMKRALDAFLEKVQGEKFSPRPDQRQAEKNISDSWLFPCGLLIAFLGGVVFF